MGFKEIEEWLGLEARVDDKTIVGIGAAAQNIAVCFVSSEY